MVMLLDLRCHRDYFVSLMLILERDREREVAEEREREREKEVVAGWRSLWAIGFGLV